MASGKKGSTGSVIFLLVILVISLYYLRQFNNDQRKAQIYNSLLDQYKNIMADPEDIIVPSPEDAQERIDNDLKEKDEDGANDAIGADRQDIIDEIRRLSAKVCLFPPDDQYGCYGAFEEDTDQAEARDEALAMLPVMEAELVEATAASDTLRIAELNSELESVRETAYDVVCCKPIESSDSDDGGLTEFQENAIGLGAAIVVGILLEEALKKAIGVKPKFTPPSSAAKAATKKILQEATEDAVKEAGEKAAKQASRQGLDEAGQKLAREVAETSVRSSTNNAMRKLSQEVGEEAAQKVFKEVGDEAVARVVREGGDKAAQLAARKLAEEGATEAMEVAARKAIKDSLGDLTKK